MWSAGTSRSSDNALNRFWITTGHCDAFPVASTGNSCTSSGSTLCESPTRAHTFLPKHSRLTSLTSSTVREADWTLANARVLAVWSVCSRFLGLSRTPLRRNALPLDRPKFRSFFSLPPEIHSFFSLWEVFSLNFGGVFEDWDAQMCTFGLSSCRAAPPDRAVGASHDPENSKRAHLSVPAFQTPPKFHETPKREKKERKMWRGERKKSAKFWAPHPSGPHTSGPHPFGAPLLGPPPFRPPPVGPPPSGPQLLVPTLPGPHQNKKLAKMRSGQIQSTKIGQIRPNKDGQMRPGNFGQMWVWPNAAATPDNWEDSSWKHFSLVSDDEVISLSHAKVYVFSDSVLCFGKMSKNPLSNVVWEDKLTWFKSSAQFRILDTIDDEPMEFEWNIFP